MQKNAITAIMARHRSMPIAGKIHQKDVPHITHRLLSLSVV
jgi:hypothetical protein